MFKTRIQIENELCKPDTLSRKYTNLNTTKQIGLFNTISTEHKNLLVITSRPMNNMNNINQARRFGISVERNFSPALISHLLPPENYFDDKRIFNPKEQLGKIEGTLALPDDFILDPNDKIDTFGNKYWLRVKKFRKEINEYIHNLVMGVLNSFGEAGNYPGGSQEFSHRSFSVYIVNVQDSQKYQVTWKDDYTYKHVSGATGKHQSGWDKKSERVTVPINPYIVHIGGCYYC